MVIQKFEYLKSFENDLKLQLSNDKKYLPISKKLVVLLREINPYLSKIQDNQQKLKAIQLQKSLDINKAYARSVENFHRSIKVLEDKNNAEVEKSQKIRVKKAHEINKNLKVEFEKIDLKVAEANQKAKEELAKAETNYKREYSAIQRIKNEAKKIYQQTTLAIETEKEDAISAISAAYDEKILLINQKITKLDESFQERLEQVRSQGQIENSNNDETYLVIKNTYNQLSIQLNKKINEIKKKHQQDLARIDKEYQASLVPIDKAIEKLKKVYQEEQQKSLQNYSEKMNSLNVIFDIQKSAYDQKKERIIHESNDAITLLNSKLSAYKESVSAEKLDTSRKMRDEMKSMEDIKEQDNHGKALARALNAFDNELNKQIIRTNKDILEKQRDQQRRLFAHDSKHLKEINEWRLKKVLYEYEKKQEFAKIDLNYQHNLTASEQQLKLLQANYNYNKEVLLLNHNKDLLPLEFQLAIAAAVQERELNLLGNDAHQAIAYTKHQETLLELELKRNKMELELEKEVSKTLFNADSQVLNVSIQLELEKEKIKRDFILSEQELRIELNQALLDKISHTINSELNQELLVINSDRELMLIENKYLLETIKNDVLKEERKREFVISEAKYKNQQRMSNEKASRFLKTYQIELDFNQQQTEDFMDVLRMFYGLMHRLKKQFYDLYHLPSHPEVLKNILSLLKSLTKELFASLISIVEQYQAYDQDYYIKKIEDLTGYKYMLKHEDTMNFYTQEIDKITQNRAYVENDIKKLEAQFLSKQSELEHHKMQVDQLLKSGEQKELNKSQLSKADQKVLSNLQQTIKYIKKELKSMEHSIDAKHQEIGPITREIERLTNKQKNSEKILEKAKHQEAAVFYKYLNHNQNIYKESMIEIKTYFDAMYDFYENLHQEVYVSDAFLLSEDKKVNRVLYMYEKQLITTQQSFMDMMLNYYRQNEKEQLKMIKGFKKSMASLILSLNQTYDLQVRDHHLEQNKLLEYKNQQLALEKVKIKKMLKVENVAYLKKLNSDQEKLKQIESKITQNSAKQIGEVKLLNDNQISIAAQYNAEYQDSKTILEEAHKKAILEIDVQIQSIEKNFLEMENSVSNKNQVLLTRYQVSHEKNVELLKQKTFHYEQIILKATKSDEERTNQHLKTLKKMNTKREEELKSIQKQHKRYINLTRKTQNRVQAKEFRILKKSHNFKMRMLHLN
ncbi:MAG: hypothetical protein CVV58_03365 [Tenericutes bacterium HGW-Tenericutes-3]|nr:MAG: hypothetical protein CVV58_03365 [Tenericutes bacterium HGW-Tenericutes-3]